MMLQKGKEERVAEEEMFGGRGPERLLYTLWTFLTSWLLAKVRFELPCILPALWSLVRELG
jgi:hypothetical protein